MKNKMARILSFVLMLSLLLSMLSVFAFAEETTGEEEEQPKEEDVLVLYNRTYDEGWDIGNGLQWNDRGSPSTIEYEMTTDYNYNYFWRLTVQSSDNSYAELRFDNNDIIGSVFEFDIKSDDYANIKTFLTFGTMGGGSATRHDWALVNIENNQFYFLTPQNPEKDDSEKRDEDPAFKLEDEWMHVAFVFDYTFDRTPGDDLPESDYFQVSFYWGNTAEYRETGELNHHGTYLFTGRKNTGKGLNHFRLGTSGEKEEDFGGSVCIDNVQCYNYANTYGKVPLDGPKGSKINEKYGITVDILTNNSGSNKTLTNYLWESYALKLNVDYAFSGKNYKVGNKETRSPILTNSKGEAYGAPYMDDDGIIWVALEPILEHCGYPVYVHKDGTFIDISTGTSSSFISTKTTTATVGGKSIELLNAPRHATDSDGNEYIAINLYDIETILPGYYVDYDPLGLIVITETPDDNVINRDVNIVDMMELMKQFIFDYATSEEIIEDVKEYTNNFTHPYIHTNQETLDRLHAAYVAEPGDENYNETLKEYLDDMIDNGEYAFSLYCLPDENGKHDTYQGLRDKENMLQYMRDLYGWQGYEYRHYIGTVGLEQPYYSDELGGFGEGYDLSGGRSNPEGRMLMLQDMLSAYIITRDEKYLPAMYDFALAMGEWKHWGPGHFLNVADATSPFAMFYDWTYNDYVKLYNGEDVDGDGFVTLYKQQLVVDESGNAVLDENGEKQYVDALDENGQPIPSGDVLGDKKYDVKKLAEILYTHSTYEGLLAVDRIHTSFISPPIGEGGNFYTHRPNNWNAVCSSGMVIGALAIIGDERYQADAGYLISSNIKSLTNIGLVVYAPEGAYIEGTGYWNYGTNAFFEMCSALSTATGGTYNMMDCWGIEKTCYFACHSESSDNLMFNYHDGAMLEQDTSLFFYVAHNFGDNNLASIRLAHLASGKAITIYDLLYYPMEDIKSETVELDYYAKSIELYCARSSWERGALFVGAMSGNNYLDHGQIDAGSFVYHNKGTVWFIDIGTEEYDAAGFWPTETRYRYYRMNAEGNNTICLTSQPDTVPHGQELNSIGKSIDYSSNEHGSYVVFDNTSTLKGYASSWHRGIMVTNDRKTTIIQDDIYFPAGVQTVYWFGHYSFSYIEDIKFSPDSRTAYMIDKNGTALRVKIVSARSDYKFEIMDTYTFVNGGDRGTFGPEYADTHEPFVPEKSRAEYNKLAIKAVNCTSFNVAVVIEEIDPDTIFTPSAQIEVGYEYTAFADWEPYADERGVIKEEEVAKKRGNPVLSSIRSNAREMNSIYQSGRAFSQKLDEYYAVLSDLYYVYVRFRSSELKDFKDEIAAFEERWAEYEAHIGVINSYARSSKDISYALMGVN